MAGRSPSTTTPKARIRDAASVRVDRASPAQAQSAAPVCAPPRPPGLVASVDLQLRSVMSGPVRGGRPPPLSSSAGGRATTQHALFICFYHRARTTHCATTLTTRNATRMCKIYVGLPPRAVRGQCVRE